MQTKYLELVLIKTSFRQIFRKNYLTYIIKTHSSRLTKCFIARGDKNLKIAYLEKVEKNCRNTFPLSGFFSKFRNFEKKLHKISRIKKRLSAIFSSIKFVQIYKKFQGNLVKLRFFSMPVNCSKL